MQLRGQSANINGPPDFTVVILSNFALPFATGITESTKALLLSYDSARASDLRTPTETSQWRNIGRVLSPISTVWNLLSWQHLVTAPWVCQRSSSIRAINPKIGHASNWNPLLFVPTERPTIIAVHNNLPYQ